MARYAADRAPVVAEILQDVQCVLGAAEEFVPPSSAGLGGQFVIELVPAFRETARQAGFQERMDGLAGAPTRSKAASRSLAPIGAKL